MKTYHVKGEVATARRVDALRKLRAIEEQLEKGGWPVLEIAEPDSHGHCYSLAQIDPRPSSGDPFGIEIGRDILMVAVEAYCDRLFLIANGEAKEEPEQTKDEKGAGE